MTLFEKVLALCFLANAAALAVGIWLGYRRISSVERDVHKVELNTNSMKDAMVKSAKIEGNTEGRAELSAEQHAQHRRQP